MTEFEDGAKGTGKEPADALTEPQQVQPQAVDATVTPSTPVSRPEVLLRQPECSEPHLGISNGMANALNPSSSTTLTGPEASGQGVKQITRSSPDIAGEEGRRASRLQSVSRYYDVPFSLDTLQFDGKGQPLPSGFYYGPKKFANVRTNEVVLHEPAGTTALSLPKRWSIHWSQDTVSTTGRSIYFTDHETNTASWTPPQNFEFLAHTDADPDGLENRIILPPNWRLIECQGMYVDWLNRHVFRSLKVRTSTLDECNRMISRQSPDWESYTAAAEEPIVAYEDDIHPTGLGTRSYEYFINRVANIVGSWPPCLLYWDDPRDYYCSGHEMWKSLPFGVERRRLDGANASRSYFVDHRFSEIRSWDVPLLNEQILFGNERIEAAGRSKILDLAISWTKLLDIEIWMPARKEQFNSGDTPDDWLLELMAEDDSEYVLSCLCSVKTKFWNSEMLAEAGLQVRAISVETMSTIERIKATHNPWVDSATFNPVLYVLSSYRIKHQAIGDFRAWKSALGWNDNGESGTFAGERCPFVITHLRVRKGARKIDDEDFRKAVTTILMLRVIFHISTSAVAALLRYCQSDQTVQSLGATAVTRHSSFCALNLRYGSQLCILSRGTHFNFHQGYPFLCCEQDAHMVIEPVVCIVVDKSDDERRVLKLPKIINELIGEHDRKNPLISASKPTWKYWTFFLARVWLRSHWVGDASSETFGVQARLGVDDRCPTHSDDHEGDDDAREGLPRAIFDLKSAGVNIRGWTTVMDSMRNHWVDAKSKPVSDPRVTSSTASDRLTQSFWQEFEAAVAEANLLREAIDAQYTSLNLRETQEGIRLTRKSLQDAHVVGRITQLAFIFLPLTFITGVFGMNIEPFSREGGASMFKFWVTTVCILVPFWAIGIMTVWDDVESKYHGLKPRTDRHRPLESASVVGSRRFTDRHTKEARWYLEYPFVASIYFAGQAVRWIIRSPLVLAQWQREQVLAYVQKRKDAKKGAKGAAQPASHLRPKYRNNVNDPESQVGVEQQSLADRDADTAAPSKAIADEFSVTNESTSAAADRLSEPAAANKVEAQDHENTVSGEQVSDIAQMDTYLSTYLSSRLL